MKKRFLIIFPQTSNIHLTKDVGMVPFVLHKYQGYESTLATYKNGEYPYLENEVKGLNIVFIKKIFGIEILDGLWFILQNLNKYDILMTYNFISYYKIWLFFFKILKGKKAKTYLKLDANYDFKKFNINDGKWSFINKIIFKKIDLITVETHELYRYINNRNQIHVKYLPNGFYDNGEKKRILADEKENLIITVGRIGDKNKSNEVLCEAFAMFSPKSPDWKLKLIGPIEETFIEYMNTYYTRFPQLKTKVEFTGKIEDRQLLNEYYRRAKLFVLTSQSESFAIVLLEALQYGCYLITTDITSAKDLTNDQKLGKIFPVNNPAEPISMFMGTFAQSNYSIESMIQAQNFAYENFYWPKIGKMLDQYIMDLD